MNDELNQKNSQKNPYQGSYENNYNDNIKTDGVLNGANLSKQSAVDAPKYMNLGAPRERDEEDYAHHEKNMKSLCGGTTCDVDSKKDYSPLGFVSKKNDGLNKDQKIIGPIARFFARYFNLYLHGPHFRLTKASMNYTQDMYSKAGWGVMVLFVSISVASFTIQSTLFVKNYFLGDKNNTVALDLRDSQQNKNIIQSASSSEFRGSDDGTNANGSSTGQKIGRAPQYRLNDTLHFPVLAAKSFLVADLKTGEIIKESQDIGIYPLASVSKLMTAVIAYEKMDPKQMAIVSRSSYNTFGTEGELLLGESIRVSDLMYPLLMESSNDGAEVLADAYGHDKFMSDMNKKALSLGMTDTYYNDPSGLDPKNVSNVEDQFKLARYIYEKDPVIFDLTRVRQFEILNHRWYSKNAMLNIDTFLGGKNGFIDEAKQTTTSLFDIQMAKGGNRKIAIMLLRTNDREGDVLKVLSFLKKNGYYNENLNQ